MAKGEKRSQAKKPRTIAPKQSSGEAAQNVDLVTSSRNDLPFNVRGNLHTRMPPMSSSKSLSGLMKWLNHDDWRDAFFSVLDQHFKACEAHGLEASELEELLGDAGFAHGFQCLMIQPARIVFSHSQSESIRRIPAVSRSTIFGKRRHHQRRRQRLAMGEAVATLFCGNYGWILLRNSEIS